MNPISQTRVRAVLSGLMAVIICLGISHAQYAVSGTIVDDVTGHGVENANIAIVGLASGTQTDTAGRFAVSVTQEGPIELRISIVGYVTVTRTVIAPITELRIPLTPLDLALPGIRVTVLRPDLQTSGQVSRQAIERSGAQDIGMALRDLSGVDAVRRGPLGFDPAVRGLRETEVGVYIDGARHYAAGPGRMDSPLSHIDPSGVEMMQVVKGPYALTWGAGNLAAIRVATPDWRLFSNKPAVRLATGMDNNQKAFESAASVSGRTDGLGYWVQSTWRQGNDYQAGDGSTVPADFKTGELRGKIGFEITPRSRLVVGGGYAQQNNIDYPGRLLDATHFKAFNVSAEMDIGRGSNASTAWNIRAFANGIDHAMNNDEKPTAVAQPNRVPPFPLDVIIDTRISVLGGRLAATWSRTSKASAEAGMDVIRTNRDAERVVARRDNNITMFEDIVWPDADLTVLGLFAKYDHPLTSRVASSTSGRLDFVNAAAGQTSDFFRQNTSGDLDQTEINVSAATSLSAHIDETWTGSLGLGTVVRTAEALERYSDRFPASKSQMSAEFVGSPDISPERSTQIDLGIEAATERTSLRASTFYRWMTDYITIAPSTLPKRLPLSPDVVFRYQNGDAVFWGLEADAAFDLNAALSVSGGISYLYGEDTSLDEPVIGISPFQVTASIRYDDRRVFGEAGIRVAAEQTRAAVSRGEQPTLGNSRLDILVGFRPVTSVEVRGGIRNLTDVAYSNHLNAKNPFNGGARVPEPGRTIYGGISVRFSSR